MRGKTKRVSLVFAATVAFVVVLMAFAGPALASYDFDSHTADKSMVAGSVHNVMRSIPGANPCDSCHIPHGAQGAFLWKNAPNATGGGGINDAVVDTDVSSAIKPLCYSCHDGSVATVGLSTAFSTAYTSHRTRAATAVRASTGEPYGVGRDCDLCHDPHDDGNTSFLKYERYSSHGTPGWYAITPGGVFCSSCHSGNTDHATNHALEVVPGATQNSRTPLDAVWVPATGDYSGTRLYDPTTHFKSTAANAVVECGSCHTPHGAQPTAIDPEGVHTLNTMHLDPLRDAEGDPIPVDPTDPDTLWLCVNCH